MSVWLPLGFSEAEPLDFVPVSGIYFTKIQAERANRTFDEAVRQFLLHWVEAGTVSTVERSVDAEHDLEQFIEQGALRQFFKHHSDALSQLLQHEPIARHLLRPATQVYFQKDGYEPLLAQFERRIYNLATHREHHEISFRYSPMSRQGEHGDSIGFYDMPTGTAREDIGYYFGTRRSDEPALNLLAAQLRREAAFTNELPVHVVTEGYMAESLTYARQATEMAFLAGETHLRCFVIHRRHAEHDRHLGAALLLMSPLQPDRPQRVIFCDTLQPDRRAAWWHTFSRCLDAVFPQPDDQPAVSTYLENGGVNLQRLHDNVPVRHQDIDCAFYTASMVRALIQLARQSPEVLISGSIQEIVGEMTLRMPEYFEQAHFPRDPEYVREINVARRWETGRQVLANLRRNSLMPSVVSEETDGSWRTAEVSAASQVLVAA